MIQNIPKNHVYSILTILSLLWTHHAYSFYGSKSFLGAPEHVCRIRLVQNQIVKWICTGTLIEQDKVLTAQHCIKDNTEYLIDCGFSGLNMKDSAKIITPSGNIDEIGAVKFKSTGIKTKPELLLVSNDHSDFAIHTLEHKLNLRSAELLSPSSFRTVFDVSTDGTIKLLQDGKCGFAGFGLSGPNGEGGIPYQAEFDPSEIHFAYNSAISENPVPTIDLQLSQLLSKKDFSIMEKGYEDAADKSDAELVRFLSKVKSMTKNVAPGDSGGSFYFQRPNDSKIYVFASLQGPGKIGIDDASNGKYEMNWSYRVSLYKNFNINSCTKYLIRP